MTLKPPRHYNDRDPHDFHPTPPEATLALLDVEGFDGAIWEPACGEGHISKVLIEAGLTVFSSDLIDRGYGLGGVDFLQVAQQDMDPQVRNIVTNPPFARPLLNPFMRKAMELLPKGGKCAMLLSIQKLAGLERKPIFEKHGLKRLWVISNRINFDPTPGARAQGGPMDLAWFIFEKGYRGKWSGGFILADVPLSRKRVRFKG